MLVLLFVFYTFLSPVDSKENNSSIQIAELQNLKDAPVELGQVDWNRNFDEAVIKAKDQNKPNLVSNSDFTSSWNQTISLLNTQVSKR